MSCSSNPPLLPGQPEFNPKKSRPCRSFRVKGRRHTVSVLKPTDERIKLEEKTPWGWELPFQPRPDWNFGRGSKGQSRRETTPSVMIPNPWATSRNWFVPEESIGKPKRWTKFMGWDPTLRDIMLKVRQTDINEKLEDVTKTLPFQPRPEWNVRRGIKGQISRERCAGKKALDERHRRLRERSSIDRLRELLPESYKNAKVKSKRFGPRRKCLVCLGYRECHLEGSTRSDLEAAVH